MPYMQIVYIYIYILISHCVLNLQACIRSKLCLRLIVYIYIYIYIYKPRAHVQYTFEIGIKDVKTLSAADVLWIAEPCTTIRCHIKCLYVTGAWPEPSYIINMIPVFIYIYVLIPNSVRITTITIIIIIIIIRYGTTSVRQTSWRNNIVYTISC
jgi:hypothetical protein